MQQGRVLLPANQPWVEPFQQELLRFPGGLYDDQVDALAWLIRMIERQQPPKKPKKQKQEMSWKKRLNKMMRGGNNTGAMAA
jgi:hypothetical protein